jgi:hypothetical protein
MKLEFSLQIFEKFPDIKFHENPSSGRQDTIIHLHSSYKILVLCHILMKLEFSLQIFEKFPDIKFHENPSSGKQDAIIHLRSSYKVLVLSSFDETWIFSTNYRNPDIKFHENPSSGRQDTIITYIVHIKYSFYVIFWRNLNFLNKPSKIRRYQISWKSV